jgi:hypothetical protein
MRPIQQTSCDRPDADPQARLRPPDWVMDPRRAAASYPNALSFSRSLVRRMQRECWRIVRVRIDLDAEGRGGGLYRVEAPGRHFHFLAISTVFPAGEKVDRSFGVNWDVSAALCQGEWSAAREDVLRDEIPKQYDGRYDPDVLCFCRGNRSERIFDDVVDALGRGEQPDPAVLASVGYILRSTAFAGNGLFGMKPFEGLGENHPLGRTYHAQILAAFLLREFVLDLVDAMARARGPRAVALDKSLKRYLGVGNSAGLGLIPFVANHPLIVDRWVRTHEEAFAEARERPLSPAQARRYVELMRKAVSYFREDPRDGNGIFASFQRLEGEFAAMADAAESSLAAGGAVAGEWVDGLTRGRHAEAVEIAWGLLLELHPDIVDRADARLACVEGEDLPPETSCAELSRLMSENYGWMLERAREPGATAHVWYYPVEAPYEPRRALRGREPSFEFESAMDLADRLMALQAALDEAAPDSSLADLLARRPDLRAIAMRVHLTADRPYAELRQNYCAADFTPFAACRFLLAFYGMEKYDPRPPRSTKGALLQGAPLADEIETGIEGEWPFPLIPQALPRQRQSGPPPPLRTLESPEVSAAAIRGVATRPVSPRPQIGHIFPLELRKILTKTLLTKGLSLGESEVAARSILLGLTIGSEDLSAVLDALDSGSAQSFAQLAAGLDSACAQARRSGRGRSAITTPCRGLLYGPTALAGARRGVATALLDGQARAVWIAHPASDGPRLARYGAIPADYGWIGRSHDWGASAIVVSAVGAVPDHGPPGADRSWSAADIAAATAAVDDRGLPITDRLFDALSSMAKRALVPEDAEARMVTP